MVDIAMAGLIVGVADNAGSACGACLAVTDGIRDGALQRESLAVGLGGSIVVVAEVAGIAGNSAMQGINISLAGEGAVALLTEGGGVARMAI